MNPKTDTRTMREFVGALLLKKQELMKRARLILEGEKVRQIKEQLENKNQGDMNY